MQDARKVCDGHVMMFFDTKSEVKSLRELRNTMRRIKREAIKEENVKGIILILLCHSHSICSASHFFSNAGSLQGNDPQADQLVCILTDADVSVWGGGAIRR